MQGGLGKGNVFVEPKARQERDGKDYAECHNVGRDTYLGQPEKLPMKGDIHQMMPHYEIVHQKVQHPVQQHVTTTASRIAEELFGDISAERSVEKINDSGD